MTKEVMMNKNFNPASMKLTIDGIENEVRYINNRAVTIGYRASLYRADLRDADLRDADLTGANLAGANLARAYLTGASLYRANLAGADLRDADLTGADLTDASLYRANLAGADLRDADGLSTVRGEPASLPEGWKYTEGKGIHKKEVAL
jgi:uncharacterized protein YjbI with pentapeptide repeats